jgi:hypothetical protein
MKCSKNKLDWAIIEGDTRGSASLVDSRLVTAPEGDRGTQLTWIRREVHELLDRHAPSAVVLRVVEPGGKGNSLPRAETDGVVQEAVAERQLVCKRLVSVSLRGTFGAKNGPELEVAVGRVPVVASTPKTRRDPVIAAVSALPR